MKGIEVVDRKAIYETGILGGCFSCSKLDFPGITKSLHSWASPVVLLNTIFIQVTHFYFILRIGLRSLWPILLYYLKTTRYFSFWKTKDPWLGGPLSLSTPSRGGGPLSWSNWFAVVSISAIWRDVVFVVLLLLLLEDLMYEAGLTGCVLKDDLEFLILLQ